MDRTMARLDRAARRGREGRLVCSWCNTPFAYVTEPSEEDGLRYLAFTINWLTQLDGVMRVTTHMYDNRIMIRRAKYLVEAALETVELSEEDRRVFSLMRQPPKLPITVQCCMCDELQLIDPVQLNLKLDDGFVLKSREEERALLEDWPPN